MMGSWKSTAGRLLAKALDWDHTDTDDEVKENLKMSISEVFRMLGEERFRQEESRILARLAHDVDTVVSTGGGIILDPRNRKILKESGYTIFLKAQPETLDQRIRSTHQRPLLKDNKNRLKDLKQIWVDRASFYEECAHFTLVTDDLDSEKVAEILREHTETL